MLSYQDWGCNTTSYADHSSGFRNRRWLRDPNEELSTTYMAGLGADCDWFGTNLPFW